MFDETGTILEIARLTRERDEMERRARSFEQGATNLQRARDELLQERNEARAEAALLRAENERLLALAGRFLSASHLLKGAFTTGMRTNEALRVLSSLLDEARATLGEP